MLTLDDGIPPWSGMFLWEPINDAFEGPHRDGSFDMSVIQHEYSHGLSNRYVAGGGALGSHQAGSMGEGWGDWYALNHAHKTGLETTRAVVGAYATGNEVRGIRNYDYNKNPNTFGDMGYDLTGPEVHADGEIWTATLWDLHKALVAKHGLAKGGEVAARLVTDGMPLTAPDPSFLDARDGILTADLDRYHGENTELIWSVFAKRARGDGRLEHGRRHRPAACLRPPAAAKNGTVALTLVNEHGTEDPERQGDPRPLRGAGQPAGPHRLDRRALGQGGGGDLPADDPGAGLRHADDRGLRRHGRQERRQDHLAGAQPRLHGCRCHGRLGLEPGRRRPGEVRLRRHGRLGGPRPRAARPTTPAPTSG